MIIKKNQGRKSGRGYFPDLQRYLTSARDGSYRPDLVAFFAGNVANPVTAHLEMQILAAQHPRVLDPVLHLTNSWRPGEVVSADDAREAVLATLRSLGVDAHQWFAAMHFDPDDGRTHVHIGVNRIHPVTGAVWNKRRDYPLLARAAEWVETRLGYAHDRHMDWRSSLNEIELGLGEIALRQVPDPRVPPGIEVTSGSPGVRERDAVRLSGYSWVRFLVKEVVPAVNEVAKAAETIEAVLAVFRSYDLFLIPRGSGARIIGPERGQHVKASRIGLNIRELTRRLGSIPELPPIVDDQDRAALAIVRKESRTLDVLHDRLKEIGFALKRAGGGLQLVNLRDGRCIRASSVGLSLNAIVQQYGRYHDSQTMIEREQRSEQRRIRELRETLTLLREQPQLLIERLCYRRSTWDALDIDAEARAIVGLRTIEDARLENALVGAIEAAISQCAVVREARIDRDTGRTITSAIYSTAEILAEEHELLQIAKEMVVQGSINAAWLGDDEASEAPPDLDNQQKRVYEACVNRCGNSLIIINGVAGSGKTRAQRAVAQALEQDGMRIIGCSVVGKAVVELASGAQIPSWTVAKLLLDLNVGRQHLDSATVLVVDEASALGSTQALELLRAAKQAKATVIIMGDTAQHGSVARGDVFRQFCEAFEPEVVSMDRSRRADEEWLQWCAPALRGASWRVTLRRPDDDYITDSVPWAMEQLRKRGMISAHASTSHAMEHLVRLWAADTRANKAMIATRRNDVEALNTMGRRVIADRLGDERTYETVFGRRQIAVGEHIIARERGDNGTVNGDQLMVVAHLPGQRIECVRLRDSVTVMWSAMRQPAFDYAYCTTSYAAQGRTLDAAYILATAADDRAGIYVDVTRAREDLHVAYGEDQISDFSQLIGIASRRQMKRTVLDVLKNEERQRQFDAIAAHAEAANRAITREREIGLRELPKHSRLDVVADTKDAMFSTAVRAAENMRERVHEIQRDG